VSSEFEAWSHALFSLCFTFLGLIGWVAVENAQAIQIQPLPSAGESGGGVGD
jgi:hypothetical protein